MEWCTEQPIYSMSWGETRQCFLSPILFNIYVDDLLHNLEVSNLGCHVGSYYYGCIMYADDLLLLSASISDMKCMLDICALYGDTNNILFNQSKSSCLKVGKCLYEDIPKLHLGDMELN
jgi:hypothetical protein